MSKKLCIAVLLLGISTHTPVSCGLTDILTSAYKLIATRPGPTDNVEIGKMVPAPSPLPAGKITHNQWWGYWAEGVKKDPSLIHDEHRDWGKEKAEYASMLLVLVSFSYATGCFNR